MTPSHSRSFSMTTHSPGNQTVHLLEAGPDDAPPVLLLHGGLGDAEMHWRSTIASLEHDYHVYAPDLPGFHEGSHALQQPSLTNIMQWITDLLESLHIEKVVLIGTSVGGLLTRFYAAQYPSRVERLVLVDGGQIVDIPSPLRMLIRTFGLTDILLHQLYQQTYSHSTLERAIYQRDLLTESLFQTIQHASERYMPLLRALLAEPWPIVRTPTCPTLIVWGRHDHLAPLRAGHALCREIPQAYLEIIEASGHLPMLEQPQVFQRLITEFLGGME